MHAERGSARGGGESQTLTVTASSSNTALIPNPTVIYTSPSATGSLSFTPVANAFGTATITVTVNDGQSANNTVTRTLHGDGERGERCADAECARDVTINEDAGRRRSSLSGITGGRPGRVQTLTVTATSSQHRPDPDTRR